MTSCEYSSNGAYNKTDDNVHIPVLLQDSLLMSSTQVIIGNIPTIFIGVVDKDYTEATWKSHVDRIEHLFQIEAKYCLHHIQVKGAEINRINEEQMGRDVSIAIEKINSLKQEHNYTFELIRIVGMRIHSAIEVHTAMEAIVKGWNLEWDKKTIQFVALGDSIQGSYLNFCKSLCLNKICAKVQFYKTADYDQFGSVRMDLMDDVLTEVQNFANFMNQKISHSELTQMLNASSTKNKNAESSDSDPYLRLRKDFSPFINEFKSKISSDHYENDHIPCAIQDVVLEMSSNKTYTGNVPTIFVDIEDKDCTVTLRRNHANRIAKLFQFDIDSCSYHIQVKSDGDVCTNAEKMGQDVLDAIGKMSSFKQEHNCSFNLIRFVMTGINSAIGFHIAMETIVKGWNQKWDKKAVQFIALGDSMQGTYFNICKSLCLKKICAQVQFYKAIDYNQFGHYRNKINKGLAEVQNFANFLS